MEILKKNDIIEIEIDGLGYDGEGIAHIGGYTVFIRYALPGEKVRATVIFTKPTFAVAKLEKVLLPSPDRTEPQCPVYYKCGGCGLQHMKYEAQLRYKRESVCDTFFKAAKLKVDAEETVPSIKEYGYRNKMSLPVRGECAEIGFFAVNSHRLVTVDNCPIQFEENGKIIKAFADFLHGNNISGYNETTHEGVVRHLIVRKIGGKFTVTVVVNGNYRKLLEPFDAKLGEILGENYAYYINFNTLRNNVILGKKSELVGGSLGETIVDGLSVSVHPQSFFQVNDGVRELLYRAAAAESGGGTVIDAYSGAGVLSAILARTAEKVIAVEIEEKAVESAETLLRENGIKNVELVLGDCAEKLPQILAREKAATVVLDPPRSGCDRRVLDSVIAASPQKIAYISCNPATLARDTAVLLTDYDLIRLTPFDMFPQSPAVENLAIFTRK